MPETKLMNLVLRDDEVLFFAYASLLGQALVKDDASVTVRASQGLGQAVRQGVITKDTMRRVNQITDKMGDWGAENG